jgi:hypothetical protein
MAATQYPHSQAVAEAPHPDSQVVAEAKAEAQV